MPRPSQWRSGPTKAIRVPERFAEDILAFARLLDGGVLRICPLLAGFKVGDRLEVNGQPGTVVLHRDGAVVRYVAHQADDGKLLCLNKRAIQDIN